MKDEFTFDFDESSFSIGVNLFDKKVKEIKETFQSINRLLKELEDENTWDSDTSREIVENSKEVNQSFINAEDEFKSFIDYLLKVLEDYKNEDDKTNKTIDNNVKNLDR